MADLEVAAEQPLESQQEAVNPSAATEAEDDVATWKRRLSGKDQALTAAQKAAEEFKSKYEELAQWKAAQEEASLSEFEKAARKIKQLEDELKSTETRYETEKLKANYPQYYEFQEKVRNLSEAQRAAEFENFVKSQLGGNAPTEISDANAPKRDVVKDKPMKPEDIKDAIRALGNPWAE
jgi:chromosome segregation ATPase